MEYIPPFFLRNAYVSSIYPTLFRKVEFDTINTGQVNTRDGDEVTYDWYRGGNDKVALISHGLGGSNKRGYVKGMSRALLEKGWDVIAWNYRACGGKMNRTSTLYHGGSIDDLEDVIFHIEGKNLYKEISLVGFSIGGSINLLYLGKYRERVPDSIKRVVQFSVPCDLKACAIELEKPKNAIFMKHFLKNFKALITAKSVNFPNQFFPDDFKKINNFRDYDNLYTAPLHGFDDAEDYWERCSSKRYIEMVEQKVLLVMAMDDPFLADSCYPFDEAARNKNISLITPRYGGHVGFALLGKQRNYWSETITADFLTN